MQYREILRETEAVQPMNLQTIADWLVDVNDDILPDEYFEVEWSEASDQECMAFIRQIFLHGSCAEFAYALHQKHGWPTVRFNNPTFSKVHYACKLSDDLFCDFDGKINLDTIRRRYRFGKRVVPIEVDPEECITSFDLDDEDPWTGLNIARYMIGRLGL